MKTLIVGHRYELENFEAKDQPGQCIQFIQKEPILEGSGELRTVRDGTTNEEVLKVLIDRMNSMQAKFPCRENAIVTTHLETALLRRGRRPRSSRGRIGGPANGDRNPNRKRCPGRMRQFPQATGDYD